MNFLHEFRRIGTGSGEVSVVSLEGFVKLKQIAGRARDLADVEALLEAAEGPARVSGLPSTATDGDPSDSVSPAGPGEGGYRM